MKKIIPHSLRACSIVIACSVPIFSSIAVEAAPIFTNVADTTTTAPGHGSFTGFFPPTVSGANVALLGLYSGGNGIFSATVGSTGLAKVVDTTDIAPGHTAYTFFGAVYAVGGSNVVFQGNYSGAQGIYSGTVNGAATAKIAELGDIAPGRTAYNTLIAPSISGANVAFFGSYGGGNGVYTGTVGTPGSAKIVDGGDTAPGHGVFMGVGAPSISGSNVAFSGGYSGGKGIYIGTVGSTGATKIVDFGDSAPGHGVFTAFTDPSLSGDNIAFGAQYSGGSGVYTGTVGATGSTKVVDTNDTAPGHSAYTSLGSVLISGNNVVFIGGYSGGSSLFVESGGIVSAVLNTGDPLFGSTVSSFSLGTSGYDNNTIAFAYSLANGKSGVAAATLPEPSSLGFLAIGATALLSRRRRELAPGKPLPRAVE